MSPNTRVAALELENATLRAEIERLEEQLAEARAEATRRYDPCVVCRKEPRVGMLLVCSSCREVR